MSPTRKLGSSRKGEDYSGDPWWKEFERRVTEMERVFADDGIEVKWSDKLLNHVTGTKQQVDVSVKSADRIIFLECQDRSRAADITWIQQLVTKSRDLRAIAVAVPRRGLSGPAKKRAEAARIEVRALRQIEPASLLEWFRCKVITIFYRHFELRQAHFYFEPSRMASLQSEHAKVLRIGTRPEWVSVLDVLHGSDEISKLFPEGSGLSSDAELLLDVEVDGHVPIPILLEASFDPVATLRLDDRTVEVRTARLRFDAYTKVIRVPFDRAWTYHADTGRVLAGSASVFRVIGNQRIEIEVYESRESDLDGRRRQGVTWRITAEDPEKKSAHRPQSRSE